MSKTAILLDEINGISQLHAIGIEGIKPWKVFFRTVEQFILGTTGEASYHYYGAIVPSHIDKQRFTKRIGYFDSLKRDGIEVQRGFCIADHKTNRIQEKAVDMMIGLDLYEKSLNGYDVLIVMSGDTDLVPAINRAKQNGSKVIALLSSEHPARYVRAAVDQVISLEKIVSIIPSGFLIRKNKPVKKII